MADDLLGMVTVYNGVRQLFTFDSYGNAVGFNKSQVATNYLYSGEQFDPRIQQQYLRARYYDFVTGRFNRLDPFFGSSDDPQSFHKYLYTHGDPINGIDPSGLFTVLEMLSAVTIIGILHAIPGPEDYIEGSVTALTEAYAVNLEWDVKWAGDFGLSDDLGSRNDKTWVTAALLSGIYNAYGIHIPFTGVTLNIFDIFMELDDSMGMTYEEFYGDDSVAQGGGQEGPGMLASAAAMSGRRGGTAATVNLMRGMVSKFSSYAHVKVKGVKNKFVVPLYKHAKFGQAVALFPRSAKPSVLPGPFKTKSYAKPPNGKRWENLSKREKVRMRKDDFKSVRDELDRRGIDYHRDTNKTSLEINGIEYTIHHHHKKGYFELVRTEVHQPVGHIGMSLWHRTWK